MGTVVDDVDGRTKRTDDTIWTSGEMDGMYITCGAAPLIDLRFISNKTTLNEAFT